MAAYIAKALSVHVDALLYERPVSYKQNRNRRQSLGSLAILFEPRVIGCARYGSSTEDVASQI